jgi:hypothetical protein
MWSLALARLSAFQHVRCRLGEQLGGGREPFGELLDDAGVLVPTEAPSGWARIVRTRVATIAGADLGTLALRLEQPARGVAALAQLRDRQIDRTHSGVELAGPMAAAAVRPLRCHLAGSRRCTAPQPRRPSTARRTCAPSHAAVASRCLRSHSSASMLSGTTASLLSDRLAGLREDDAVVVASGGPSAPQARPAVPHALGLKLVQRGFSGRCHNARWAPTEPNRRHPSPAHSRAHLVAHLVGEEEE